MLDGAVSNYIGRIDGIILVGLAIIYMLYSIHHNNVIPEIDDVVEEVSSSWKAVLWVTGGIFVLFL